MFLAWRSSAGPRPTDPDGNMIEVYWPTGDLSWRQPSVEPLDLSQPDEALIETITATP